MKKPLALTLIAAMTLSACATKPPPDTPTGYLVGSLGYAPEGKVLLQARLKLCKSDGEVAYEMSYRPLKSGGSIAPGALTEPGFAGEVFVATLPAGDYYFCGSEFSERPADPSALAQVGDVAYDGLVVVGAVAVTLVLVAGVAALLVFAPNSFGSSRSPAKPHADLVPVSLTVEAGKISYIGRYRGFQRPAVAGEAAATSGWLVLDQQDGDLASALDLRSDLKGLPTVKALPSADLPAKGQPAKP